MGKEQLLFENIGERVSFNGSVLSAAEFAASGADGGIWDADIVYEVLRIIDGIPMFFEDHNERLECSLRSVGADAGFDREWLSGAIRGLFEANGIASGNVKIWVSCGAGGAGGAKNWFLNVNHSFYPPPEYYKNGVRAELLDYTRANPNVKLAVAGYKEKVRSIMESTGAFELLLCDGAGNLTEGSRTNLFFVIGDRLFTAPDSMILKGVVKKRIFAAAAMSGIEIVETPVRADMLGGVDGVFITSTSIGALPVSHIGGRQFGSAGNPVIVRIERAYAGIERAYIDAAVSARKNR
jgi:branched-chain amino acid aminotransferase